MIVLGRVVAPYGIKGWVRVHPFGDDPLGWRSIPVWCLADDANASVEAWRPRRQEACALHAGALVVHFEGVNDRTAAEALRGKFVGAPREALPATAGDEYYWVDLVGLSVANTEGVGLGRVAELIESGANTVLVLRDDAGVERLLPFTAQVIRDVRAGVGITVEWGADW